MSNIHEEWQELIKMRNNEVCTHSCGPGMHCWECEKDHEILDMRFLCNFQNTLTLELHYILNEEESLVMLMTYPCLYEAYKQQLEKQ